MTLPAASSPALRFSVAATCATSRARASVMELPHGEVLTPVFMPVGTKGTIKGLTSEQVERAGCQIILANTYHMFFRPGVERLRAAGGLHKWMSWRANLLTDSGGFQMVSLREISRVSETGVEFQSTYDASAQNQDDHGCEETTGKEPKMHMLTPEDSISVQHAIGADIIMQLDDVVAPTSSRERIEEAMHRSVRWLDRCIATHAPFAHRQNLFPIVQGGVHLDLRRESVTQLIARNAPGYAIGGLCGGEDKSCFWKTVALCCEMLPQNKPRYCMGVGYAIDLVVCVALGVDMFDCVFPTRTARFGRALVRSNGGALCLENPCFAKDYTPIDANCRCPTCKSVSRAYLHANLHREVSVCAMITQHNIAFQMDLMRDMRNSIIAQAFPAFVRQFCRDMYPNKDLATLNEKPHCAPQWAIDAFSYAGIDVLSTEQ